MAFYNGLPRDIVFKIYNFVQQIREKEGIGQRNLTRRIERNFNIRISENTVSGWIYQNKIPFLQEETQFKPKPIPSKKSLNGLYTNKKFSASKIAKKFQVSTATVIGWLKHSNIRVRTHLESMNTFLIRKELGEKRLTIPKKDYSPLTPEKAYIYGVLIGDGCINKKFLKLEIRNDTEFVQEFSDSLKRVYGIFYNYRYYKPRNSYILDAASHIICKDLLSKGSFGTYSWRVPNEIIQSNDEKIMGYFLRGFYDSEGSVGDGCITLSSINISGLKQVGYLLEKIGIKNTIKPIRGGKYRVLYIFRKQRFKLFRNKIGFTIKRKREKLNGLLKNDRYHKEA